jgi:1-acyl-sn-glycerol-3-phosphate acyltransferase
MVMALRSLAFQAAFFAVTALFCVLGLPLLVLPRRVGLAVLRLWARSVEALVGTICGISFEVRGREHIPAGAAIVASKHQSAWETISLLHILPRPALVLKRELSWIPLFGWYTIRFGNLPVDRGGGGKALRRLVASARRAAAEGRPIVMFPEGTRRPPGAPAAYHRGIVALYLALDVACVPVALNSGHYWPRRSWRRRPGRIVVEFLEPIAPGLGGEAFLTELENRIEPASARLLREAVAGFGG